MEPAGTWTDPDFPCPLLSLRTGTADALVVAKLDRAESQLLDFAGLMERASERGGTWSVWTWALTLSTPTRSN